MVQVSYYCKGGGGGARMEGANVSQAKWFHLNKHSCQKNLTLQFHEGNDLFNDARNTFYLRLHWKEMFYLMMYSTHFNYGYIRMNEVNDLFNDACNTFYLWLH